MASLYTTRFQRLAGALAVAASLAAGSACGRREPARPDVLMVVVSGLRADHVSAYGYRRATTPATDGLAATGTLFESAIATAPWGLTSQASILTGLYPAEHAAVFERPVLEDSLETLPEKLKAAGYATFGVSTDSFIVKATGFAQGVDSFVEIHPEQEGSPDEGAASAEKALLDWLAGREGASATAPFFAYVVLSNPHLPFNPPGEYRQKFLEKPIPLPRLEQISQLWLPFARQFTLGVSTLSPDELGALVALYDGEVAYADYRVGRIVESLRASGTLDQTLVIVTSDVGEDLGDHGLLSDASRLYDSIVRVPLVMRLPGRVPAGLRVADQVQTVDIAKAVMDLTTPAPAPVRQGVGTDAPIIPARPVAICEARFDPAALRYYRTIMPGGNLALFERNMLAVRTPEYKYIVTSSQEAALFDLKADPSERVSVLQARMDKAIDLSARINEWAALLRPPPVRPGSAAPPDGGPQAAPTSPPAQVPAR